MKFTILAPLSPTPPPVGAIFNRPGYTSLRLMCLQQIITYILLEHRPTALVVRGLNFRRDVLCVNVHRLANVQPPSSRLAPLPVKNWWGPSGLRMAGLRKKNQKAEIFGEIFSCQKLGQVD